MMTSTAIKKIAKHYGADLCGIASIDRFANAPANFHPKDILNNTQSVISIACRIPTSTVDLKNKIPYSTIENIVLDKVHSIAVSMSLAIEDHGYKAVMVPSVPYDYWDEDAMEGRGLLSLKHIGYYAGIGTIGKNSLLYNSDYGNMIKLGAILTDLILPPDELQQKSLCPKNCNLCITSCPVNAIKDFRVNQRKCRLNSEVVNKRGVEVTVCNSCRNVCPNRYGQNKRRFALY